MSQIDTIPVDEVVFREEDYPRSELDPNRVQKYKKSLGKLEPIEINQDNVLIDGWHRLKAHESAGEEQIEYRRTETNGDGGVLKLAIRRNASHGYQLTDDDKRKLANKLIGEMSVPDLADLLSVTDRTVRNWTERKREQLEQERDEKIEKFYLRAWNSQSDVADMVGCSQPTVTRFIQNGNISDLNTPDDFEAKVYDIWRYNGSNNQVEWPGEIPQDIVEQLLYYYTEPLDVVFDPFAGGGITVDACKKWKRRYWTCDIQPAPEREDDILEHDITDGVPDGLGSHQLAFLDPPYWKMKRGEYTDFQTDLSNLDLDQFLSVFGDLAKELKCEYLAVITSPFKQDGEWHDLPVLISDVIREHRDMSRRVSVPYTTEIHGGNYVKQAKENQEFLYLNRELRIFE